MLPLDENVGVIDNAFLSLGLVAFNEKCSLAQSIFRTLFFIHFSQLFRKRFYRVTSERRRY